MLKSTVGPVSILAAVLLAGVCTLASALPVFSSLPALEATKSGPGEAAYARGLIALNNNNLAGAETGFKEALASDPKFLAAALGMADVAIRRGRIGEVRTWLEKARGIKPNSVEVETAWARFHYSQRDYGKAEEQLKNAAKLGPQAFLPRIDLADLYLNELGKPQQAIEFYRDAIRTKPAHAGAHFGLGMALARVGDPVNALIELQESSRLEPANPLPWRGIGQVHSAQKRFDEAIKAYSSALKLKPDFAQLFLDRGEAYGASGDDAKAMLDYDQALKLDPKLVDAHVRKGMTYQRLNKPDEAQAAYLAALAINSKYALVYNNLAWMAAERKTRLDDALKWATTATEIAPKQARYFDTLGWVHRARGDLNKAVSALNKAVSLAPKDAESYYHLGIICSEQNLNQRAVAALKTALTLDPNFAAAPDAKRRLAALGSN